MTDDISRAVRAAIRRNRWVTNGRDLIDDGTVPDQPRTPDAKPTNADWGGGPRMEPALGEAPPSMDSLIRGAAGERRERIRRRAREFDRGDR